MVKEKLGDVDYYTPTMPLKVRNDNESNKSHMIKSKKTMNLNDVGRIIPQVLPQEVGYI
jgi:hypothetical protein